jgi:hypothetical protein
LSRNEDVKEPARLFPVRRFPWWRSPRESLRHQSLWKIPIRKSVPTPQSRNRLGSRGAMHPGPPGRQFITCRGDFAEGKRGTDILVAGVVSPFSSVRSSELSQSICSSPLLRDSGKPASQMPSTAILQEVHRLYAVSDRLDSLADQHPLVSEALLVISGSVRNTATLLGVLVATKMSPLSGLDPASQ